MNRQMQSWIDAILQKTPNARIKIIRPSDVRPQFEHEPDLMWITETTYFSPEDWTRLAAYFFIKSKALSKPSRMSVWLDRGVSDTPFIYALNQRRNENFVIDGTIVPIVVDPTLPPGTWYLKDNTDD